MTDSIKNCQGALCELKDLVQEISKLPPSTNTPPDLAAKCRLGLIKLRRAHANMRAQQTNQQGEISQALKRVHSARSAIENAEFVKAQCNFLVNKFNATQCPELDKVMETLPSIEKYTEKHCMDDGFVSHEANPHQFMLAMLGDELVDRKQMEDSIVELARKKSKIEAEVAERKQFLEGVTLKVAELSTSLEGIKSMFGLGSSKVAD